MAAKVKASNSVSFKAKPRKKLRRHTKHINKHKSSKPNVGQG
jgi:hypothetical protein